MTTRSLAEAVHPAADLDLKRVLDISVGAVGLVAVAPLLIAIGIAIRADSPGPAIFRQERVGLNGKVFRIHKFRTLKAAAGGPLITVVDDPRVTRVGGVLRRTKLDELPQ